MADEEFVIRRAERTQTRLRIALQGASGGGKTASSLLLASGMVAELGRRGKLPQHLECQIGLIDTERDSAKLYSHLVPFDTIVLSPPYTVDRYLRALTALERAGYPVIVIDQISHEWFGEGGILAQVAASKAANDFAKWNGPSQDHERFMDRLLASSAHLIVTMRSKTEWALEEEVGRDGRTRKVPKRIGMQARQREGTEYEFTTLLDLEVGTNIATCLKDRTELFTINGRVGRLDATWGGRFIEWVYTASKPEPAALPGPTPAQATAAIADAAIRELHAAPNVPDLIKVFDRAQKRLRALSPQYGGDVVAPELARVVEAKDAAKGAFGVPAAGQGACISPEELLVFEQLLSDIGIDSVELREHLGIPRLAMMPAARYDEAVAWLVKVAERESIDLEVPPRPVAKPPEPSLREKIDQRIEQIGNSRGGLFAPAPAPAGDDPGGFATMRDDLPFPA